MKKLHGYYEQMQQLISNIYDAALEQNEWETIVKTLTHTLKAEQGYIRILDKNSNDIQLIYKHNKDNSWVKAFKDYYVHQDPWLNNVLINKNEFVVCTHHHIMDKEYEKLEYYQDYVQPQKMHYGIGSKIPISNNMLCYLALNRDKKKQGFEEDKLQSLKLLTPHIQKALMINDKTRHIELEHNLLRDALNKIDNPLLLVNKTGKVLFINAQAEKIIEQLTGIVIANNHLVILSAKDMKVLQNLIHQATLPKSNVSFQQGGAMNYTDPLNQTSVSILVSPVNPDKTNLDTYEDGNALLLLNVNNQQKTLTPELLKILYKMTKAEAKLTMYLCQGLTLSEISEKIHLSKNTLRTQLRSCFNKIGVSRQAELIQKVITRETGIIK